MAIDGASQYQPDEFEDALDIALKEVFVSSDVYGESPVMKTVDDRLFSDGESRRDAWNRLKPFYDEVMSGSDENILIVSHGDLLSIWNAMYLGLPVESFYKVDIHGAAGGVSHMFVHDDGKHRIKSINDMSYIL